MVYQWPAQRDPIPGILQPDVDVRGGLGLKQIQAPARHLEERSADRPEVLRIAGEQVEALDWRLVCDAAGEEQIRIRIRIDFEIRVDVELVLARHAD